MCWQPEVVQIRLVAVHGSKMLLSVIGAACMAFMSRLHGLAWRAQDQASACLQAVLLRTLYSYVRILPAFRVSKVTVALSKQGWRCLVFCCPSIPSLYPSISGTHSVANLCASVVAAPLFTVCQAPWAASGTCQLPCCTTATFRHPFTRQRCSRQALLLTRVGLQRSRAAFSTGFTLGSAPSAANPHSSRLERFAFAPIETPFGFFRAGVDFQPAAAVQVPVQDLAITAKRKSLFEAATSYVLLV